MFARASIILPTVKDQIVIPQSAISFTLYGENVYVIHEADGVKRAKQVVVKAGERRGNDVHVLSGIKAGDQIVLSGQVRLSNDTKGARGRERCPCRSGTNPDAVSAEICDAIY